MKVSDEIRNRCWVGDDVRRRHPAGERDRRVARRQAAAQRRAAARVGLRPDHDDDRQHERDQRDLGRCVAEPVEQPRAAVGHLAREDEVADRDGVHGRDQDGARGDVLGELRERVERGRRDVDRLLDRRVDHLGDEHEGDREQQRDQLQLRDADRRPRRPARPPRRGSGSACSAACGARG